MGVLPAKVCCTAGSKGTGCVTRAGDCDGLGGTVLTRAEPACTRVFPGYPKGVTTTSKTNCAALNYWTTTWTASLHE